MSCRQPAGAVRSAHARRHGVIGYEGPISVEWEDAGMDRLVGAPQALAFVRANLYEPPTAAFDSAFSNR